MPLAGRVGNNRFILRILALSMALSLFATGCDVVVLSTVGAIAAEVKGRDARAGSEADFQRIGTIEEGDVLPAGMLHLYKPNLEKRGDQYAGSLVVDLPARSAKGEESYAADILADCSARTFAVHISTTWSLPKGSGKQISSQFHEPPRVVTNLEGALREAMQIICRK